MEDSALKLSSSEFASTGRLNSRSLLTSTQSPDQIIALSLDGTLHCMNEKGRVRRQALMDDAKWMESFEVVAGAMVELPASQNSDSTPKDFLALGLITPSATEKLFAPRQSFLRIYALNLLHETQIVGAMNAEISLHNPPSLIQTLELNGKMILALCEAQPNPRFTKPTHLSFHLPDTKPFAESAF